jgi:hypothetical protein
MAKSLLDIIGVVYRKMNGKYRTDQIYEAFMRGHRQVYQNYLWPWTQASYNIQIQPLYNSGTVSITDQTAALAGSGTTWLTSWLYKKLSIGANVDYPVLSFSGTGAATLAQTINLGYDITDGLYTIYQDTYSLPSDCEPGGIVCIVNPGLRYRLLNTSVYRIESNTIQRGVFFNNLQFQWCECGYDDTNKVFLIRLDPPPSTTTEYRMMYNKHTSDPSLLTDATAIPPTWDIILEHLTEAEVKRTNDDATWEVAYRLGYQAIQKLRQRIATQIDDAFAMYPMWSQAQNSIVDPSGLVITGPVTP